MSIQLQAVVALNTDGMKGGLSSMGAMVSDAAGAMMASFGGVTTEILAMGKAFGPVGAAIATLKEVSSAGMGVQQSIANLRAETGFTSTEIKGLTDLAMSMSTKMTAGTGEITKAMAALHANGSITAEAIKTGLVPALQLADVAGMDVAAAADVMNTTMKNFGLTAVDTTRFVNVLAEASNPVEMQAFTEALLRASQTAQGYGISLNETAAMMKLFEEAGIEGGKAGQAFTMVMDKLSDAAKTMKGAIGAALAGWNPAVEGMAGALDRLKSSSISSQKILEAFGPRVGGAMVKMMAEGGPALTALADGMDKGRTQAGLYKEKNATLGAELKKLGNVIENLNVSAFLPMSKALAGLIVDIQEVIQWFGKLVAALMAGDWSKVKTMLTDVFDSALKSAQEAFDGIRAGAGKLADMFKSINWGDSFSTLKTAALNTWDAIISATSAALSRITAYLRGQNWSEVWDSAKQGAIAAFNFWYGHVAEVWGKIAGYLKGINGAELWEAIKAGATKVWAEIESIAKAVWPTIQKYAENVWTAIAEAGRGAWEAIKQAWSTVDWSKVMDDISSGFDKAVAKVREFGNSLVQYIGLPQTFTALSNLLDALKVTFAHVANGARELFAVLKDVKRVDVLNSALKTLDAVLSSIVIVAKSAVQTINGMIEGWNSLSDITKIFIAVLSGLIGGAAGLIVLAVKIYDATVAIKAMAVASQLLATSQLETLALKLMYVKDAIIAFATASSTMVVAAGLAGAGLGLLIRQIPGVSDAIDGLFISAGKFLGLVEKEDPVLKANAERLKEMRIAMSDMITANEKEEALDKMTASLMEQEDQAAEARNTMIELAKATASVAPAVDNVSSAINSSSAFYDKFTSKQNESARATLNDIVAMRQFTPAALLMIDPLKNMGNAMGATATETDKLSESTGTVKVNVTDLVGMLAAFKGGKISSFDVSGFISAMKQLKEGLKDFTLPEIKLPDFSKFTIPKLHGLEVADFISGITKLANGLKGIDFGNLKMPDFSAIKIPNISSHAVDSFISSMRSLKNGLMNIDFGSLGKMDINIKGGGGAEEKLGEILGLLKGAKGIVWA